MMFLKVPFAEKDEAKALGARWNGERKSWYVPEGKDTAAFARWLPPGGADFIPAVASGSIKTKPASVDSYVGKNVVGKYYQALDHDCDPFTACPVCAPALKTSGWQDAHDGALQLLAAVRG